MFQVQNFVVWKSLIVLQHKNPMMRHYLHSRGNSSCLHLPTGHYHAQHIVEPCGFNLSGLQKPFPPCLKMVREITGFPMQEIEAIAIKLSGVSPLSYCFFPSLLSTDASEKCIKYHRIATKLFAVQCLKNKNHPKVLAHVVSWQ